MAFKIIELQGRIFKDVFYIFTDRHVDIGTNKISMNFYLLVLFFRKIAIVIKTEKSVKN